MKADDLVYYKLNLVGRWVVEVIDQNTLKPCYQLTELGAEYITAICAKLPDAFPEFAHVYAVSDVTKTMENLVQEKIFVKYYDNGETFGVTDHGYNMLKVLSWLLDIKKQSSYKRKIILTNGVTTGINTIVKIMQGVMKFGLEFQPPPNKPSQKRSKYKRTSRKSSMNTSGILSDLKKFSRL